MATEGLGFYSSGKREEGEPQTIVPRVSRCWAEHQTQAAQVFAGCGTAELRAHQAQSAMVHRLCARPHGQWPELGCADRGRCIHARVSEFGSRHLAAGAGA